MRDPGPLSAITELARELQKPGELEEILQLVVDSAARSLRVERASLRVLDPTRTRLIAVCRSGESIHLDPDTEFRMGEGLVGWIAEHVKTIRTGDAEKDPRFAERGDRRERIRSFLGTPVVSGHICLGVLGVVHPEPDAFTEEHEELLTLISYMCGPFIEERRFSYVANVDPLTSAISRRGLAMVLPDSRISDAGDLPVSVIMVDLDRLSEVNERMGNVIGDHVLRETSRLLGGILGAGDALVRYGGEEFLMVLPGVDGVAAGSMAEQARRAIQSSHLSIRGVRVSVTASFGVAERRQGESRSDFIRRADEALLAAKKSGRNRVVVSE